MKFNLESGRMYLFAAMLSALLALSFTAPVFAQDEVVAAPIPQNIQAFTSSHPSQVFLANATLVMINGTVSYNFLGTGGNDTFNLFGGNSSAVFVATGLRNNTFNITTGNPSFGLNSTTFSLVSGANSTFNIVQNNFNGSITMIIVAGSNSFVNMTSIGPISSTILSIALGTNSTTNLSSQFIGNQTTINIVV